MLTRNEPRFATFFLSGRKISWPGLGLGFSFFNFFFHETLGFQADDFILVVGQIGNVI